MYRIFIIVATAWVMAACGQVADDPACLLEDRNYLNDADFALEDQSSRSKHWTGIQHAGEKSFAVSIDDAVVSIERIGSQPWFLYRQRLKATDLAGRKMAFSAELRLLGPATGARDGVDPPVGLKLSALSASGKALSRLEQRLASGESIADWQKVQLVSQLPPQTQTVELSFFYESEEGTLQVRSPSFREVSSASSVCAVTSLKFAPANRLFVIR